MLEFNPLPGYFTDKSGKKIATIKIGWHILVREENSTLRYYQLRKNLESQNLFFLSTCGTKSLTKGDCTAYFRPSYQENISVNYLHTACRDNLVALLDENFNLILGEEIDSLQESTNQNIEIGAWLLTQESKEIFRLFRRDPVTNTDYRVEIRVLISDHKERTNQEMLQTTIEACVGGLLKLNYEDFYNQT